MIFIQFPSRYIQRRQRHPTPVLLPGKSHGWRSLVGCSPWGCEESDMSEWLHFHFSLLCIGEGNGNPLQCSCLGNPRDGVVESRTQLKWLSSRSRYISWFLYNFLVSLTCKICVKYLSDELRISSVCWILCDSQCRVQLQNVFVKVHSCSGLNT